VKALNSYSLARSQASMGDLVMCNDIRQTGGRHAGLDTQEALPDKDSQSLFLYC